jgi:hypothetical protein
MEAARRARGSQGSRTGQRKKLIRRSPRADDNAPLDSSAATDDCTFELLLRACDADENLGEDTKRFIDRHVTPGD